jgi:hypothetical protein
MNRAMYQLLEYSSNRKAMLRILLLGHRMMSYKNLQDMADHAVRPSRVKCGSMTFAMQLRRPRDQEVLCDFQGLLILYGGQGDRIEERH